MSSNEPALLELFEASTNRYSARPLNLVLLPSEVAPLLAQVGASVLIGDADHLSAYEGLVDWKLRVLVPRSAFEAAPGGISAEVLQCERIGSHDNFFTLGGHSLLSEVE